MKALKILAVLMLFFLLAPSSSLRAQKKRSTGLKKSCQDFVQAFYDWYVPKSLMPHEGFASDLALKLKHSSFSPELARQLKEDSDVRAEAAKEGELDGLDFDPFLHSQDPDEHYVAGRIAVKGTSYWAEVHSVRDGKKSEKPDVVAELVRENGRWIFVNFHYGTMDEPGNNLLNILKNLREFRGKTPK